VDDVLLVRALLLDRVGLVELLQRRGVIVLLQILLRRLERHADGAAHGVRGLLRQSRSDPRKPGAADHRGADSDRREQITFDLHAIVSHGVIH
jgi:hypothetical protein